MEGAKQEVGKQICNVSEEFVVEVGLHSPASRKGYLEAVGIT